MGRIIPYIIDNKTCLKWKNKTSSKPPSSKKKAQLTSDSPGHCKLHQPILAAPYNRAPPVASHALPTARAPGASRGEATASRRIAPTNCGDASRFLR